MNAFTEAIPPLQLILMKASQSPGDGSTKQVASHNKICQHVSEIIRSSREEWDIDTSRGIQQTSSAPDTAMLISAVSTYVKSSCTILLYNSYWVSLSVC